MKRVVTAAEMREMDRRTIEDFGVDSFALMSAAGEGLADCIRTYFELDQGREQLVVLLCGKGNNGGDGFVAATKLRESSITCMPILLGARREDLAGDAAQALNLWTEAGGDVRHALNEKDWQRLLPLVEEADLVVDAMLGTGAQGQLKGVIAEAARALDQTWAPVVAVDMPTGVNSDTGALDPAAVFCDLTVTFALPKRGQLTYPGKSYCGHLEVVDIGIPQEVLDDVFLDPPNVRVEMSEYSDMLMRIPARAPDFHKGDRGRLLLVGGSSGLTGAVALAADAAVRAGAGLVTMGVPRSLADILETKVTEAMTLPLAETEERGLAAAAASAVLEFQGERLDAAALGPGAGRAESTLELFRTLAAESRIPLVIDADAIYAFAGHHQILHDIPGDERPVLTPHWGEFLALTGLDANAAQEDRVGLAAEWAQELNVVLVLKGAPTVIADGSGTSVVINSTGNESLATGGSGDVLTGVIAGFLAQNRSSLDAAIAGVYFHGYLADYLVEASQSRFGHKAGDLITVMPEAFGSLFP